MHCIRLTLAYDGTAYAGWQVQPGRTTVQGILEAAIERVTGKPARTLASGRTDAGVHALGQVVGFRTESRLSPDILLRALNAELPHDVAVLDVARVNDSFHPIRDALSKRYRYVIHDGPVRDIFARNYSWQIKHTLDAKAMGRGALGLLGRHDFSSFESAGAPRQDSIRTITDISVARSLQGGAGQGGQNRFILIEVEADGFLYNMVRAIVGTLVEVGRGSQSESWPAEAMAATDRGKAGPTAPPQGLFLVSVEYGQMG
ncbi:MAG: tRNA pseudouridine(38-40) synthase TruA [Planctomycetota bacterium]|nr:tRNA pseudouridine(38-40) synthase TruA [Planctomycetota bacterium]